MEGNIRDIIGMTRNMDKAHIVGWMGGNTLESGKMIKGMERESMLLVKIKLNGVYGRRIRGLSGLINEEGLM